MKRLIITACLAAMAMAVACTSAKGPQEKRSDDYLVAAYIWPSCHDDSLGHAYLWPEGIGEWEVIKQGDPRFEGHYQPKRPLWGYEMDDDPVVVDRWIKTAREYGINTFVYDWYWFKDYQYLEGALNDGFLKANSCRDMNFYIMWANHDVKWNYWNYHLYGDNEDILFDPDLTWDQFKKIVDRIIKQYFCQPNYVKFDGRPVMSIFSMDNLARGFGGLGQAGEAINYFREEVKKAGYPDLYLMENFGGGPWVTDEFKEHEAAKIKSIGIDAVAFYNMGGFDCDYRQQCENSVKIREQWDGTFGIPNFPCVSIGWDDTPRFPKKGAEHVTRFNHSPEVFKEYLQKAKDYADAHPDQPKLITINAWNEWVEGSYLLPDEVTGFGYLEAVREVMGTASVTPKIDYKDWKLEWSDEFEGNTLDTSAWSRVEEGTPDWCRHMSLADGLVSVENGNLVLKGIVTPEGVDDQRPFITGGVLSKGKQSMQLGMFEVRAKYSCGQGFWPAIWLMPDADMRWPEGGEIDIMEHLNHDKKFYQTIHTKYIHDSGRAERVKSQDIPGINPDEYNVYAAVIEQDAVKFYINGEEWLCYKRETPAVEGQFPFADHPFYMILSAQLGGNWVGEVDPAELPVEMDIDYVRFYKKK
ncbi:MAG: glycoside hydrolase family 99-like domain-containing protein [Bacteroidales bacterium]|nr:glycoside hydrolase family 99-like domain-containing protein [Candidatus Cryptobacteroides onthequi]